MPSVLRIGGGGGWYSSGSGGISRVRWGDTGNDTVCEWPGACELVAYPTLNVACRAGKGGACAGRTSSDRLTVCARDRWGSFGGPGPVSDEFPRKAGTVGLLPGTGGGPDEDPDAISGAGKVALRTGRVGGAIGVAARSESAIAGLLVPEPGGEGFGVGLDELGFVERSGCGGAEGAGEADRDIGGGGGGCLRASGEGSI